MADSTNTRHSIFAEIEAERAYQDGKWGTDVDDSKNTPWMWAAYIGQYATNWMKGTFVPLDLSVTDAFRVSMIKVAAIAVAAVESLDRQRAGGGAFYEANPNG